MRIPKILQRLTRRIPAKWFSFIGRSRVTTSLHLTTSKNSIPQNLFHRCNETPLAVFIECVIDHNYQSLVKSGTATEEQISEAWQLIYSEYSDLVGGETYKLLLNLSREIGYLETKLLSIGLCLKVMTFRPDPVCIRTLESYGYRYDWTSKDKYMDNIAEIANKTAGIQLSIERKRRELEKKSSTVGSKQVTRQTFETMIAAISKHMGFRIDPKEVTVSEFVSYRKNFEGEIEAMKKHEEKRKMKGRDNG